jgi:hypothetical protein
MKHSQIYVSRKATQKSIYVQQQIAKNVKTLQLSKKIIANNPKDN